MLPCYFYTINSKKVSFKCIDKYHPFWVGHIGDTIKYIHCPNYMRCKAIAENNSRVYGKANVIVNFFGYNRYEVVYYPKSFNVVKEVISEIEIDNKRNFKLINGLLYPCKDTATISKLQESIHKCSKRAQDTYYGYALSNVWDYFFTFTFSSCFVNRSNDLEITLCWQKIARHLQSVDPNVKILCVPERHEDGCLHLHVLVSFNVDLLIVDYGLVDSNFSSFDKYGKLTKIPYSKYKNFLMPYYDNGKLMHSKTGEILFVPSFSCFGRSSCAILPKNSIKDQLKAVNYLIAYTTKQSNLGFGKKRYWHTHNLHFKNKSVSNLLPAELNALILQYDMLLYKEFYSDGNISSSSNSATPNFVVYRNFNNLDDSNV